MGNSTRSGHSPPIARIVLAVAMLLLIQAAARADSIQIAGITSGDFGSGATVLGGLTYVSGGFDVWTAGDGSAGIGGATDNLGTLALSAMPFSYYGHTFDLTVSIDTPSGSGAETVTSHLFLSVNSTGDGGVALTGAGPAYFTFPAVEGTGSFLLWVNGISLTPGQSTPLTGFITGARGVPVPEPYDFAIVGFGALAAFVGWARRRIA